MLYKRRLLFTFKCFVLCCCIWFVLLIIFTFNAGLEKKHNADTLEHLRKNYLKQFSEKLNFRKHEEVFYTQYGRGVIDGPLMLYHLTNDQKEKIALGYENHAFNQYISDLIPLDRSVPDLRSKHCKQQIYSSHLKPVSVIICFHNEAWSTLLRTIHSVLKTSPSHLLLEIILVDDFSNMIHLYKQLEDYIKFLPKVKLLRTDKREGLVRARQIGIVAAKASILAFLDSHSECVTGWLEPLLQRIFFNPTIIASPVLDIIDDETFTFIFSNDILIGGFDWQLQYIWEPMSVSKQNVRRNPWDPVLSPTIAGGYFVIEKSFFEKLGTYDSEFNIWGVENLELSFKTWMCGGSLEIVPCSHVGHVFRKRNPYNLGNYFSRVFIRNAIRLAEVWLDDYKKYFYRTIGNLTVDFGDITSRKILRQNLKCQSFEWYLKNIYPERWIPNNLLAYGQIRNKKFGKLICKNDPTKPDELYPFLVCHNQKGYQLWMLTSIGEIRKNEKCLNYLENRLIFQKCHRNKRNQFWFYDVKTRLIRNKRHKKCLEYSPNTLFMAKCVNKQTQQWSFEYYNTSLIKIN